jgi:hypothetical protein
MEANLIQANQAAVSHAACRLGRATASTSCSQPHPDNQGPGRRPVSRTKDAINPLAQRNNLIAATVPPVGPAALLAGIALHSTNDTIAGTYATGIWLIAQAPRWLYNAILGGKALPSPAPTRHPRERRISGRGRRCPRR